MYTSVAEVMEAYDQGEREFDNVGIDHAVFSGSSLRGARFFGASLHGANFDDADLTGASFTDIYLTESTLRNAQLVGAHLGLADLAGARLTRVDAVGAKIINVDLVGADLTRCRLIGSNLVGIDSSSTTLERVVLGETTFSNTDVSGFCDAVELSHVGPSYVDFRSVLRSYRHPGLKRFLVDCGVPPLVAEFTIAAAEAEGNALGSLMRSTFISYGGPDEAFARRLYDELRAHGVTTFFFPETARLGRRIGDEVHSRIQEHDRVILVCSRASLDRPGVRNEIQETFDREARDGGATYLIPIRLDDYVLTGWDDALAPRVRDRVVGDFSGALDDDAAFDKEMRRLLAALKKDGT